MADAESTPSTEGDLAALKRDLAPLQAVPNSYCDYVLAMQGNDEQARATNLLRGRGLPGDPGNRKTIYHFYVDDRRISVSRVSRKCGAIVTVRVGMAQAELSARDAERQARQAMYRALSSARKHELDDRRIRSAHAFLCLTHMVHSPKQYQMKMIKELRSAVRKVHHCDLLPNDNHGYSMAEHVGKQLEELLDQMVELIAGSEVRFDSAKHKEINRQAETDLPASSTMAAVYHEAQQSRWLPNQGDGE